MRNHAEEQTPDGEARYPVVNQLAVLIAAACQATELGADISQTAKIIASIATLQLDQPPPAVATTWAPAVEDKSLRRPESVLGLAPTEAVVWEPQEQPVKKGVVGQLRTLGSAFVLRNLLSQELHVATFDSERNELVLRVGYRSTRKANETRIPVAGAYRWAAAGVVKEVMSS